MKKILLTLLTGLFTLSQTSAQTFDQLRSSADSCFGIYDIVGREKFLEEALTKSPEGSVRDTIAGELANNYTMNWKFDKARPLLEDLLKKVSSGPLYLNALRNRGLGLLFNEKTDSAYALMLQVDSATIAGGEKLKFIRAENLLGLSRYYRIMANIDEALFCTQQTISICKTDSTHYDPLLRLANGLASSLHLALGDVLSSKKNINAAGIGISRFKLMRHPYYMEPLLIQAEYNLLKRQMSYAANAYEKADSFATAAYGPANAFSITCYNNRGMFYLNNNDATRGRKLMESALKALDSINMEKSMMYMMTLNNVGYAYCWESKWAQADSALAIAFDMTTKAWGREHYLNGLISYNQSASYRAQNRLAEAGRAIILGGKITQAQLLRDMAEQSEKAQLGVYNLSEPLFQALPSFLHHYKEYRPDSALVALANEQLLFKGMVSLKQNFVQADIRRLQNDHASIPFNRWIDSRRLLSASYTLGRPRPYVDSLEKSVTEQGRALQKLAVSDSSLEKAVAIKFDDVAKSLKPGQVAVDFIKYRSYAGVMWSNDVFYSALVYLPNASKPVFVDLFEEKTLSKILKFYYSGDTNLNDLSELYIDQRLLSIKEQSGADSLYTLIWKPLEKYLKGVKQVNFSPVGLLNLVAFGALPDQGNRLLLEKYDLVRYQRISDILHAEDVRLNKIAEASFWGGIDYGDSVGRKLIATSRGGSGTSKNDWMPLPFSLGEVQSASETLQSARIKSSVHSGPTATRDSFLKLRFDKPAMLHIASHGFYDRDSTEQPVNVLDYWSYNTVKSYDPLLRTGLVLANANQVTRGNAADPSEAALLTSFDIASMDLGNVKLAVLSACETAMGDIENADGVFGFQRALKVAGVEKMILSLWPVRDRHTQEFMKNFYRKMAAGSSVREAFIATQLDAKKRNSAPVFWAGFILVE